MFGLQDCELSKNGNVSLCEIKAFESLCENLGFFISAICCCCWTGKINGWGLSSCTFFTIDYG